MSEINGKSSYGNNHTSNALLEQLVYIDNFISNDHSGTPSTFDFEFDDHRLSLELATFADDSFIFPDEDKPKPNNDDEGGLGGPRSNPHVIAPDSRPYTPLVSNVPPPTPNAQPALDLLPKYQPQNLAQQNPTQQKQQQAAVSSILNVLPKVPVPPGAKSSLAAAGLSSNQIDALAALIAQHQGLDKKPAYPARNPSVTHIEPSAEARSFTPRNNSVSAQRSSVTEAQFSSEGSPAYTGDPVNAAEGDKRRRNTQASARFRIKKKMKEQQLEATVTSLNEMSTKLQLKIQQLEMENKLLRNLIVDKNHQRNLEELADLKEKAKQD
ncbi:hypothetical protein BABINDRAFT_51226, partial [Babjeviella inositovora NRRL Y-12698]